MVSAALPVGDAAGIDWSVGADGGAGGTAGPFAGAAMGPGPCEAADGVGPVTFCVVAGAAVRGATRGGPGVGGGIATGGITGRDLGGSGPAPTSTGRLTTTVGAGAIGATFGVGAARLGTAGAVAGPFGGAAIFTVAALPSALSGTRFEKVLIEDF
jgi:hypothetical protein